MSDLIDRQSAIDMIEKYFDGLPIAVHHDMLAMIHRLPSVHQDRKPGEWLHDLLQDAIDAGIITETQASRLMDRIAEDNT